MTSADQNVGADGPAATQADVQATYCATLVDEWQRAGLTDAVVAPGSRSTPLAIALLRSSLRLHVVLDERSASFVALGIGRATGRPAVLLCTSGTAAAEFHAAVVEAGLDDVPMLVCTADRPPELHHIGAPQTIDQQHLFGRSVRWFCEPGSATPANVGAWRSLAARAVLEAVARRPGPVHLNLAFREPLVGSATALPAGRAAGAPWHGDPQPRTGMLAEGLAAALSGRRGVIVAGAGSPPADAVLALARALGWPVLADPRSGCRLADRHVVSYADAVLRSVDVADHLAPDVVVRFGAPFASKVVATWLARCGVDVLVDPQGAWMDPARSATSVVAMLPEQFCEQLVRGCVRAADPAWLDAWVEAETRASIEIQSALTDDAALDGDPTDPTIARAVLAAVPTGGALVVSSSMPVRDLEWYGGPRTGVDVHANRGANGIDGVLSTAIGVALAGQPTTCLIGDLAFLHDVGALTTATSVAADLTVVVVDNHGGAIFEFLPQASQLDRHEFETLFGTPQNVDLVAVASGFGANVRLARTAREVADVVARSADANGVHVVVVRTDRSGTVALHDRIHRAVATAVASLVR